VIFKHKLFQILNFSKHLQKETLLFNKLDLRFLETWELMTYAPFGHMVSKTITQQNIAKPYDFVFLTGDIAYAGISSQKKG
jgi:hypothetical protein